ncbi:MAG: extracellular solute-binding protein [Blautia sp.]|nr:extracellular solute-binding protein [Blautia sp.]
MRKKTLTALLSTTLIFAASCSAFAEENVTAKTVHMGDNEIEVEVTDIGISGSFTYWSAFTGDSAVWEQKRVDAFNEAYADLGISVEVQYVPDGAGINNGKLLSAIAGGTAPDLLISDNPTSAYQYAAEGCFASLDGILDDIGLDVSSFYDGCKDVMYYDDTCYLVPQDTNVIMLYYRPDIAAECGLDPETPPTNLEELDAWADAMTVQADDGSYSRFGLIPWLDSGDDAFVLPFIFGADPYLPEENRIDLTSDQMLVYMNWIQSYARKYDPEKINAFTSGLGGMFSPDHAFMTGKAAMTFTGNWFTEALRQYAPDVEYRVCPVPVPEGGRVKSTSFGCNVFAIPEGTDSEKAELAALFIKFCEQGSVNEDNFAQWRSIPVIDAAFDEVSLTKNGDEIYALEREIAASPENGIPALCAVSAELSSQFQSLRETLIYNTDLDPKDELQALEDQMNAML